MAETKKGFIIGLVLMGFSGFFFLYKFITGKKVENHSPHVVNIIGKMKNVIQQKQFQGILDLKKIPEKSTLYGLGPIEFLTGEILIFHGKSYIATINKQNEILVEESFDRKVPFFVFSNINGWREVPIPKYSVTLIELEKYIDKISKGYDSPFAFLINGEIDEAVIHVVDMKKGSIRSVSYHNSIERKTFRINSEMADVLFFFSKKHKGVFTHHDTYLHSHLITQDRKKMGHVDELYLRPKRYKLYFPDNLPIAFK